MSIVEGNGQENGNYALHTLDGRLLQQTWRSDDGDCLEVPPQVTREAFMRMPLPTIEIWDRVLEVVYGYGIGR